MLAEVELKAITQSHRRHACRPAAFSILQSTGAVQIITYTIVASSVCVDRLLVLAEARQLTMALAAGHGTGKESRWLIVKVEPWLLRILKDFSREIEIQRV